jgi:hypothetical protein
MPEDGVGFFFSKSETYLEKIKSDVGASRGESKSTTDENSTCVMLFSVMNFVTSAKETCLLRSALVPIIPITGSKGGFWFRF